MAQALEARLQKLTISNGGAPHVAANTQRWIERRAPRTKAYKFAIIRFGQDDMRTCIVVDLSPFGAKIRLEGAQGLPREVQLSVPDCGLEKRAQVRWQSELEAGLCF